MNPEAPITDNQLINTQIQTRKSIPRREKLLDMDIPLVRSYSYQLIEELKIIEMYEKVKMIIYNQSNILKWVAFFIGVCYIYIYI